MKIYKNWENDVLRPYYGFLMKMLNKLVFFNNKKNEKDEIWWCSLNLWFIWGFIDFLIFTEK